jgi:diguanylate cyclase (GGDEF)-like protein
LFFDRANNLEYFKKTIQYLYDAAITDSLTKLPRRNYIRNFLSVCIAASRATIKEYALFTDLNGFDTFNNTYGHDAGDLVLETFGKMLLSKT